MRFAISVPYSVKAIATLCLFHGWKKKCSSLFSLLKKSAHLLQRIGLEVAQQPAKI